MGAKNGKIIDIYARVSEVKRRRESEPSTDSQVAVCRTRLAKLGLQEGKVLVDVNRSAWNPAVKRPAWDELIDRLERRLSHGAIVFDLERLTRIPKDGERMIDLADRGIQVLDSESEYDLTSPNGKKAFRDAINAAAYYSDRLSTRISRGKKLKAMSGRPNGTVRPFGFEADLVTIREDEAAVLREVTARILAGETVDGLVADLNARGIVTSRGNTWTRVPLLHVLNRPRNCGRITYTDQATSVTSVVSHLPGDPIISEEDFDRVIAIFAGRRYGHRISPTYLCSGVAICGRPGCGNVLHGRPVPRMKPYEDGSVRREYWCGPANTRGCGKLYIDQRSLDEAVGALTVEVLADPHHADAIEATAREIESETVRLALAITEAEGVAEALADRLGRGEITLSRYDIAIRPLDERIAKLKDERAALGVPPPQRKPSANREHWERRWTAANQEEKRALLKLALRGRRLIIAPPAPGTRALSGDVTPRIRIE
jgi:site-specific DNA recombinase